MSLSVVVPSLRHRTTTPLADTTRFSQGSSRLATLGFGAESLWNSLEFPKGIGQECPRSGAFASSWYSGGAPAFCRLSAPGLS